MVQEICTRNLVRHTVYSKSDFLFQFYSVVLVGVPDCHIGHRRDLQSFLNQFLASNSKTEANHAATPGIK